VEHLLSGTGLNYRIYSRISRMRKKCGKKCPKLKNINYPYDIEEFLPKWGKKSYSDQNN